MYRLKLIGVSVVYAVFVLVVAISCYKQGRQDGYEATTAFYKRSDSLAKRNDDEQVRELIKAFN